eukprot:gnl/TRDRNA2_/TRDRNA2_126376_c0_seq1.p1 gnl/TRDRNA2_/TRDRNA2_126376_c0~~gnl/TRDRNA2_/TRDRNA2_126376_c0_seq1.p1  ORF type:complete len:643 (+),score=111.19 gnl/TRDRNA2_/TRDRNA2_126376_c0_seq1:281-1930(+)
MDDVSVTIGPGDSEGRALMLVDLALELHRRAETFKDAGDSVRSEALLDYSADQLVAARAMLCSEPAADPVLPKCIAADRRALVAALDTVLSVWQSGLKERYTSELVHLQLAYLASQNRADAIASNRAETSQPDAVEKETDGEELLHWRPPAGETAPPLEVLAKSAKGDPTVNDALAAAAAANAAAAEGRCEVAGEISPDSQKESLESAFPRPAAQQLPRPRPRKPQRPLGRRWCCFRPSCMFPQAEPKQHRPPGQHERLCLSRDFRCGETVGAGSQGCVFQAQHARSGMIVAVKEVFLDKVAANRGAASKRLARELRLLEQLEHPSIVRYLGHEFVIGAQGGPERVYLFLEFCSGGSLSKHLRAYGPLEEPLLRRYVGQLVDGLCYLHSLSPPVVHRDLKCDNLLLAHDAGTGATNVKITDFGCSKGLSGSDDGGQAVLSEAEHSVVGSVFWMAPEVLRGRIKLARPVDIWSVGCCVVEMVTGKRPWAEKNFDNILQASIAIMESDGIPLLPAHLPEATNTFVRACLRISPAERPSAAELRNYALLQAE